MKLIEVKLVAHEDQRYPTWADWEFQRDGSIQIRVSSHSITRNVVVNDRRYMMLSAIHELVEALVLSHQLGGDALAQLRVDQFDVDYEERRMDGARTAACGCEITDDPGSDMHAPYKTAHHIAEQIEYGLAKILGVDPKLYDEAFLALDGGVAGNRK
jgi:hypothetical protein